MIIKYKYVTGEVVELQVPNHIAEATMEIERETYNNDRRETRRHNSVENIIERGFQFEDKSIDIAAIFEQKQISELLQNALEKLIKRFCDYNKILYCEDTKELMIINWIKYNVPNNTNAIKCVNKELKKVKHKEFLTILFDKCTKADLAVDRIFDNLIPKATQELSKLIINKHLSRWLKGTYKGLPSNRIRSNKKELINNNQEGRSKEEEIIKTFSNLKVNAADEDIFAIGEAISNIKTYPLTGLGRGDQYVLSKSIV